jgi:hypothetical protein
MSGAARAAAILLISCHFDHHPVAGSSQDEEDEMSAIEMYEMDDIFCSEEEEDDESSALADDGKGRNKFRGDLLHPLGVSFIILSSRGAVTKKRIKKYKQNFISKISFFSCALFIIRYIFLFAHLLEKRKVFLKNIPLSYTRKLNPAFLPSHHF